MNRPRVAFAGTPEFAARALRAIVDAGFEVPIVLTQPDRPAGRGLQTQPSAVKRDALARGLAVFQPSTLRTVRRDGTPIDEGAHAQSQLRGVGYDVMVVAAYGLILPQAVLDIPRAGCINIHASLLPRWRGAAPIQRAVEAGDARTGISIMRMDAGLDTGPVLLEADTPISAQDTAGTVHDRLADLGATLIVDALGRLDALTPRPQPDAGATYAAKIDAAEQRLDFARPAAQVAAKIRAFNPVPGAVAQWHARARPDDAVAIKCWFARTTDGEGAVGEVLRVGDDGIDIACTDGAVRITELQRAGGKRLAARDFVRGAAIAVGDRFA